MLDSKTIVDWFFFACLIFVLAAWMSACGVRIETYGYAPDSFFREDRQVATQIKDDRRYEK